MWWFWWWPVSVILLPAFPVGSGWGYRRWGPPYPSWTAAARERRAQPAATWGLIADLVWVMFVVAAIWFIAALVAA
jgi:hypothetical protein